MERHLLIIGTDAPLVGSLVNALTDRGFDCQAATALEPGYDEADAVVLVDPRGADGLFPTLEQVRKRIGNMPLALAAPAERVESAREALRHGADEYLLLPVDAHEAESRLNALLERHALDSQLAFYQEQLSRRATLRTIEARSPAMRDVVQRIQRVAPLRSTVLIYGESGAGKELVARSIHFASSRNRGPFVALNCAAIPASLIESELFGHEKGAFTGAHNRVRGKFEAAHRGTLFLDEIGEMDPDSQTKLLRVLEEREFMRVGGVRTVRVDVRVIAATNARLEERVASGQFRQDLYYRLKVLTITVPPLRDRQPDIPALIEVFSSQIARANALPNKTFSDDAVEALSAHSWPGNVRELKNALESLIVSVPGSRISVKDLPLTLRAPTDPLADVASVRPLAEVEREMIVRALEATGGNRTHSAELLDIGVRTLQRKIHAYGIDIPPTKRRSRRHS